MLKEKIVHDISSFYGIDENIIINIISICQKTGRVSAQDVRQFTEMGLPIVKTASNILQITPQDFFNRIRWDRLREENIEREELLYDDLLIVLGIIAQDCMVRYQELVRPT